ncbi:uncharacterized protein apof [Corythoichthys intestinalis]|uniref:uncharacterized protein apof n=1 Tax=Corythoichthys intestinalis TaxID=161448 RepID=UPI0025A5B0A3|nr:uncharacterized protein apof [Corythoichthys intestinalis]XP_061813697.1 uncharacterized protein LOC133604485 [Nerophis lumbriciformis]
MMSSKFKWMILVQLLLNEQAFCRVQHSLRSPTTDIHAAGVTEKRYSEKQPQFSLPSDPDSRFSHSEKGLNSAKSIVSLLKSKLQGMITEPYNESNISCGELLSVSGLDDPFVSRFPQELLGLSLVPVLVVAHCAQEAHTLVVKLYDLLGVADTDELLLEVANLIQRRTNLPSEATTSTQESDQAGLDAVMFNIQQLATLGKGLERIKKRQNCKGWTWVNGTALLGVVVKGSNGGLEEAMHACEKLGVACSGITSGGLPGRYQAVFKKGSRILPSLATDCWIHQCNTELSHNNASSRRLRRTLQKGCINQKEERVYRVVEWIPAVSTLYNLGTAVYYASVNCSETAKERAVLTAVDLGTDALIVATGGAAGVAGYALGAGVKTGVKAGVKYLLGSLKHEDVLVNQSSREEGVFTVP